MPLTTQSENTTNIDRHFSVKVPKELFLTSSQVFIAALAKNGTESDRYIGGTHLFLAPINKKALCNLISLLSAASGVPLSGQYLIPRKPPAESLPGWGCGADMVSSDATLNTADKVGAQTRKQHRCNLISRSIGSTKVCGGRYTSKCNPWNSAGTFFIFNFQMV